LPTHLATRDLEAATWAAAEGRATPAQLALLEEDPPGWRRTLDRLLFDTEENLASVRRLQGIERELAEADIAEDLARLHALDELLSQPAGAATASVLAEMTGEVRLQASWAAGQVVVWAAGPGTAPAGNDELADRLEAIGGPALGWSIHPPVVLPSGHGADALSIPVRESLGWLVAAGAGTGRSSVGASVVWLGRVALLGVRLVAGGAIVPTLRSDKRANTRSVDASIHWLPALVDSTELDQLVAAMPGPVVAISRADARATTLAVLGAVVDAIVSEAAGRVELPAPPPVTNTIAAVAEAVATRLDGSTFSAPLAVVADVERRLEQWTRSVTSPARPKLVVQLDPPDRGDAWFLSVLGPGAKGRLLPIEVALGDTRATRPLSDELVRLERLFPVLLRPGQLRRGQVVLSQSEAWELMTVTGATLEAAGFEVRVPELSRRKPTPSLRLFSEITGDSVVGAHQLSNVRWSVLFDDVELTAAEIARLAAEARPLVRSRGRWVELDRVDLKEAAAALAERATKTQLTGAEILRFGIGLDASPLAGGLTIEGAGWATDLLRRAQDVSTEPVTRPEGFRGELRSYQAEALAWLGFLDAAELGGCLALDMGLGKTPTVLAHLARTTGHGPSLVIAPPAVVGNWAAEAARFTPSLRVVVHHGASRATAEELESEVADADVVITTYGTAVRDVDALSQRTWARIVLDEAQAIKNTANETAQQLRRLNARMRLALTGTPIENGLGDLWSILDFTNPGLVGSRPAFISQMSGEGEAALRALNGLLVFRRTKSEPEVAAELPDRIDELDHCTMTPEQIGLYQAVLDGLVASSADTTSERKQGAILAAITALKQICNHPAAYQNDDRPLAGRSGKLARLEEIVEAVFAAGERILVFTHFAEWGRRLAVHLTEVTGVPISCYDGSLARGARDRLVEEFQRTEGAGALILSLKAGGTGLNLTAASHVVLYDRWWNPAVEDQARDRAWRIGQTRTVVSHRLICPGTVDERVEEVVAGKRHIADLVLPKSSSLADLDAEQLRIALGLRPDALLTEDDI
jgi:SNF2-related domain/SNF2 Helicase protein/Helicase conserved C-terminal domain